MLGGKGSLHRWWQEGGSARDKGQVACPWLGGDAECVCVVQGCRSVGVMNELVVTWERAGTNS